MAKSQKLILASGSPRRVELLAQAAIEPDRLMPMDIDEKPGKNEHPRSLARRLSYEKAEAAVKALKGDYGWSGAYVLSADTVVSVGRRILPKAELVDEASNGLYLLSGRSHRVFTGVCLVTPDRKFRQKIVETRGMRGRRMYVGCGLVGVVAQKTTPEGKGVGSRGVGDMTRDEGHDG